MKFKELTEQYLENTRYTLAPSNYRSQKSRVNNLNKVFGKKNISAIKDEDIAAWITKQHQFWSNKTINEHLTVFRAVFTKACKNKYIEHNAMEGICNLKTVQTEPNPFTKNDVKRVYEYDAECFIARAIFVLGSQTGLRISELLALDWESVNFKNKTLQVKRGVFKRKYRVPKTSKSRRKVDLNDHAIAILERVFELTGKRKAKTIAVLCEDNKTVRKETVSFIFYNSKTKTPFIDGSQYAKTFLTPILTNLQIEHRGPGQLRHTYASQALTAGINENYIAKQMGHSNTQVIRDHYARWIDEDADDNADKLGKAFDVAFSTDEKPTEQIIMPPGASITGNDADLLAALQIAISLKKRPSMLAAINGLLGSSGGVQ
ncbi:site-specific integrase [Vibrio sp. qd031]|uniref:tyrosine-type recombinase/integrase n=1 Tax=Vibrio sp. qd031 TaxID=1603038 RepID=UPI000A0FD22A|nr:site-specific integrase [Vibrio sp. qd031]